MPENTSGDLMHSVKFYGASDDLIEVEGNIPGCDEYNTEHACFQVAGLQLAVGYASDGTWAIAVGMIDEGVPVTAENVTLGVERHSMVLTMDVPPGAYVARIYPDGTDG